MELHNKTISLGYGNHWYINRQICYCSRS